MGNPSAHTQTPHTSSSFHHFRAPGTQPGPSLRALTVRRPELITVFNIRGAPALSLCELIKYSLRLGPAYAWNSELYFTDADRWERNYGKCGCSTFWVVIFQNAPSTIHKQALLPHWRKEKTTQQGQCTVHQADQHNNRSPRGNMGRSLVGEKWLTGWQKSW